MDAKDPHFMAAVTLIDAEKNVQAAKEELKAGHPRASVSHIRAAMKNLADVMEELYKKDAK
jgi:hypothetical protein